jgi:hypothetical protein
LEVVYSVQGFLGDSWQGGGGKASGKQSLAERNAVLVLVDVPIR